MPDLILADLKNQPVIIQARFGLLQKDISHDTIIVNKARNRKKKMKRRK